MINKKNILIIVISFILSLFLWNTFLLYPVKLFVVALHELSHGMAAIAVGGKIDHIEINYQIGGYCRYFLPAEAGFFSKSLVAAAGYLGSMIWGALIFILASRTRWDRIMTLIMSIIFFTLSLLTFKSGEWFGILFCLLTALFLLASYRWLPESFHDTFLKFLGLTSCLYVIIDIKEDLIDRTGIGSDADAIAEMIGAPSLSIPIGILWIVLAILVLIFSIKITTKKN
jgi:hypothetical protein